MSEDLNYKYFQGKKPNRTYISRRITTKLPDDSGIDLRIVSKVIDSQNFYTHDKIKNQVVLRVTTGGRQQVIAKLYEPTKDVFVLSLQRYTTKTGNPHEISFSFVGDEILILKNFLESIKFLDFSEQSKSRVEDEQIEKAREFLLNSPDLDLLIEMAQKKITKRDVVALGYRREQLTIFSSLIANDSYFNDKKSQWGKERDEDVWQMFFEKNPWIFGYGLNLVFHEPLQGKKLEQVVKGFGIDGAGKKVDAMLKTRGIINSLCLLELKTHKSDLLKKVAKPYRPDCWQLSDPLNGGIAQIQKTMHKTQENIGTRLTPKEDDGTPTGEEIYLYQPKSYLVIGNLSEFISESGINQEKLSSFELFRRNIVNPEIITFDELYERAEFIVQNNEEQSQE